MIISDISLEYGMIVGIAVDFGDRAISINDFVVLILDQL